MVFMVFRDFCVFEKKCDLERWFPEVKDFRRSPIIYNKYYYNRTLTELRLRRFIFRDPSFLSQVPPSPLFHPPIMVRTPKPILLAFFRTARSFLGIPKPTSGHQQVHGPMKRNRCPEVKLGIPKPTSGHQHREGGSFRNSRFDFGTITKS